MAVRSQRKRTVPNYQNNLNLISKNENYRIGYQKNDADKEYRYLIAQHTVNAVMPKQRSVRM